MPQKTAKISFKCTEEERQKYDDEARSLGFSFSSGKTNFSKYLRWILENGQKPIPRDHYQDLQTMNQDLVRLGSLFNQYIFHLNRELKILNDRGMEDESNPRIVQDLEKVEEKFSDLYALVNETHEMVMQSALRESA